MTDAPRDRAIATARAIQEHITAFVREVEGAPLREDTWQRPGGGGGRTRVIADGRVFEKGGVNWSAVHGTLTADAAKAMAARDVEVGDGRFFATGTSVVLHPRHPRIPTVHCNYRYFELDNGRTWWVGGGADLTPYYVDEDGFRHFHAVHKAVCDAVDPSWHPRFKAWADDYFHLRHRSEHRGIGGLFFDDLADRDLDELLAFQRSCGQAFTDAYRPFVDAWRDRPVLPHERDWQLHRRGRYVEFNLVWDRGTVFGLHTQARIESVLMSLPPHARWTYDHHPDPGTPEAALIEVLTTPRDWV